MRIVFLGSGNVATHMALALKALGHTIVQVYSRKKENAMELANQIGAEPVDQIARITSTADLYIFSIKDDALPGVIADMPHSEGVWVHTAGSVPMNVFSSYVKKFGVLYPLQTFSKQRTISFSGIPLFIEGNCMEVLTFLEVLAVSLSGNVHRLCSEKRAILHLAAVFAGNFSNHMYALADRIIAEENISFDVLRPLIAETTAKAMEFSPNEVQTGPAVRGDEKVMQAHLELLNTPELRELYTQLSKSIHSVSTSSF